jgi:ATP-dependent DNA helicase 2 subunit 2
VGSSVCHVQDPGDGVYPLSSIACQKTLQIYHARKTDQCGVMLFGSEGEDIDNASVTNLKLTIEETNNIVNEAHGGYDNVSLYIPIAQPGAHTLAKLAALQPSTISGDRKSLSF